MIDLIWIKRVSDQEDIWLLEHLSNLDRRYKVIVVGHTNLNPEYYNFKYIPFYENGIDSLGLICHKKNLGIKNSTSQFCLVLHSDMTPSNSFYNIAINKNYNNNSAIAPLALYDGQRSLTWCIYPGKHKDMKEKADSNTYISGGAIFGTRQFFLKYQWNEALKHNMEEDVELSRRIMSSGANLLADEELILFSKRSQ